MSDFDKSYSVTMSGTGLCPGVSVGTAYRVEPRTAALYQIRIARQEVSSELRRLREAVEESRR
ncbi:MAG: phosphoenolpyruvate-utilizing N-terminal domain-containing protein, partial [Acidobacteriota bacterium]